MISLMKYFTVVLLLTMFLFVIGQLIPINLIKVDKVSPYECGFDPINSSRLPFSFRFFLIAILFLMFDLEMALLIPLPFSLNFICGHGSLALVLFIMILSAGLYYEWVVGGLEWASD